MEGSLIRFIYIMYILHRNVKLEVTKQRAPHEYGQGFPLRLRHRKATESYVAHSRLQLENSSAAYTWKNNDAILCDIAPSCALLPIGHFNFLMPSIRFQSRRPRVCGCRARSDDERAHVAVHAYSASALSLSSAFTR